MNTRMESGTPHMGSCYLPSLGLRLPICRMGIIITVLPPSLGGSDMEGDVRTRTKSIFIKCQVLLVAEMGLQWINQFQMWRVFM